MSQANETRALQERFAPHNHCFGCGPSNEKGLRIRSFPVDGDDGTLICEFTPEPHHEAFDGIVNGGIIGALFDCHCNWTANWHLMQQDGLDSPPCTVTMDFHVKLKAPTPSSGPLRIVAKVVERDRRRVTVEATMEAGGKITATCSGNFIAVKPDHPAYHRW